MAKKNETQDCLGELDDHEYFRHLAQWIVDNQEAVLKYSPKDDVDFIHYESLYAELKRFQRTIEKF